MQPSAANATLIATLTAPPSTPLLDELADVAVLEMRADLLGDVAAETLRGSFSGRLLYTLRSEAEGGAFAGSIAERHRRLAAAARSYDLVDLEAERDLANPELLAAVAPAQRILSWHGGPTPLAELKARFEAMARTPAFLYKLVPAARRAGEELAPLLLLHGLQRPDVAAFATGAIGAWTRLVAPRFGAPVIYAACGSRPGAPGQIPLSRLRADFGLPELRPVTTLFGLAGNPVDHSLSPRLHNTAYRALGLPYLYLPFHVDHFADFWLEVVEGGAFDALGLPLRGLSVTAPHKEAALAVAGAESPLAGRIGAANTLIWNQGVWEAESTDPDGVVLPLRERGLDPQGKRAAVIGTGGGGRSAAVGLARAGAQVTLTNRGTERGERAGADLKLPFVPLAEFSPAGYDVLVNATSLGRSEDDALPFDPAALPPGAAVVDMIYAAGRSEPTRLLAAAAARGAVAIDGREVLLSQALGQFRLMTGAEMPRAGAREVLGLAPAAGTAAGEGR